MRTLPRGVVVLLALMASSFSMRMFGYFVLGSAHPWFQPLFNISLLLFIVALFMSLSMKDEMKKLFSKPGGK
jgi:hypothetical protein